MNTLIRASFLFILLVCSNRALAATEIDFGDNRSISIGVGAITSYQSTENNGSDSDDRTNEFKWNSARLIVNGQWNDHLKGMFRTERLSSTSETEVIDANLQYQISPDMTLWMGRFLSPSDRANMSGPYNSMGGGFWAGVAARFAAYGGYVGRDDGVAIVGRALDRRLHYSIGAFDGDNIFRFAKVSSDSKSSNLMYAGRLQYDFWDIEPGYYGTANYFGKKDIFSIGLASRFKKDGVNTNLSTGDYKSHSLDVLFEKTNTGPGTISIEAAYYYYDMQDVLLGEQGKSYLAGSGYIFNNKLGLGQIMPFVRYQKFLADGSTNGLGISSAMNSTREKVEYGINYLIEPYSTMFTVMFSETKTTESKSIDAINIVMQIQF